MAIVLALGFLVAGPLAAEQRPRTAEELFDQAEIVVVGRIVDHKVTTERSRVEKGFGNHDLIIDVTLEPKVVEKGAVVVGEPLVARCYRVKSRKSLGGMIGMGGQRPIPAVGTEVRAHLQRRDGRWWVVYPNGFAPVEGGTGLADAPAIAAGRGRSFTYGLPVEHWILFAVTGLVTFGVMRLVKWGLAWRRARPRFSREAGS